MTDPVGAGSKRDYTQHAASSKTPELEAFSPFFCVHSSMSIINRLLCATNRGDERPETLSESHIRFALLRGVSREGNLFACNEL